MALTTEQIKELVATIKLHVDWALFALIGPKAISDKDLYSLKQSGLLPMGTTAAMVENAFVLGILQAVLTRGQWKGLTYEELLQEAVRTHTPIEQLAIQAAELEAASAVKRLFTDIAEGAYTQLAKIQNDVITEATIRDIIRDRVKLALLERQSYQQLASDLAHTLETDWRRDWRRVAETELQRAKVRGHVHAIVNKVDVYQDSDGPDSRVSIVPAPDACEDCQHHYLEEDGNPKIFKLSDLIAAGSNADPGVSHKRSEGRHHHWKTTLPPLHPRCFSKDTEVLTQAGWLPIASLTEGMLVLSLNPITKDLEYVPVAVAQSFENEETLLHFHSRNFSLKVTKDHTMVGLSDWAYKHHKASPLHFRPAQETGTSFHHYRGSSWVGTVPTDLNTFGMSLEDFCVFMGLYLSEGNCHPSRGQINITQYVPEKKARMLEMLIPMQLPSFSVVQRGFYLKHDALWDYLSTFGKSYDKYVPEWLKQLPKPYISLFLDAFALGDGSVRKGRYPGKAGKFRDELVFTTSSPKLAADIGELLLKQGYHPSYYREPAKTVTHANGTYTAKHDQWYIRRCYGAWASKLLVDEIQYNDTVYCVTLEKFHTLYVRVDGKCTWSGNCGCNITVVPDGFHWQGGKLRAVKSIEKGVGSPTAVPKGPPRPPSLPKTPSLPGMAAPGNVPGPGRPPSLSSTPTRVGPAPQSGSGTKIKYEYWSGPGQPPPDGSWEQSETGAWRRPVGSGGAGSPAIDPMAHASPVSQQDPAEHIMAAAAWAQSPKPRHVVQEHMTHGDFGHVQDLGGGDTPNKLDGKRHANKAYKVAIVGNGNALWKPQPDKASSTPARPGVVPVGTEYVREEAASKLDNLLELGICPPTATRSYGGASGSLQAWAEFASPIHEIAPPHESSFKGEDDPEGIPMAAVVKGDKFNPMKAAIEKHPELQEEFSKLVVFDIISNNTDRHHDNYLIKDTPEGMKVVGIDNGLSFGCGLNGYRSWVHRDMHKAGYHVKIPDDLKTRLEGMTLGDFQRALGDTPIEPWAATQSYLRTKYILHLQETEGHLDFGKFVFSLQTPTFMGADDAPAVVKQQQEHGRNTDELFHKWAGQYLYKAATSSEHPDHEIAKDVLSNYSKLFPTPEEVANTEYAMTLESLKDADQEMNDVAFTQEDDAAVAATPVARRPKISLDDPFGTVGKPLREPT